MMKLCRINLMTIGSARSVPSLHRGKSVSDPGFRRIKDDDATGNFSRETQCDGDYLRLREDMRRHFPTLGEARDEIDLMGRETNFSEFPIAHYASS
jgi:hypothetical protein